MVRAIDNDFEGNKKMFWIEVNRVRKGEQAMDELVNDENGQIFRCWVEMRRRLAENFDRVLNMADVKGRKYKRIVGYRRMLVVGELNARATSIGK